MIKEKTKLKNGKFVYINLFNTKDNYIITASNEEGHIVAKCIFEISTQEVRLIKDTKIKKFEGKYLVKRTNPLNKSFTSQIVDKNFLTTNYLQCNSKVNLCMLDEIEITDKEYFKIGLGSLLFKKVEMFAKSNDCQEIMGWFYPNGDFWHGAKAFYIKNGFTFKQDNDRIILRKNIMPTKEK